MFSRPLAILLLALAVITAAAGGSYLATRHNAADATVSAAAPAPLVADAVPAAPSASQPVAETEAPVTSAKPETVEPAPAPAPVKAAATRRDEPRASAPARSRETAPASRPAAAPARPAPATTPAPVSAEPVAAPQLPPPPAPEPARPFEPQPEPPRVPQFEELILPSSSVIGLQMESTISTERARLEDRVEARVTRDVLAGGRVAIPAGSRMLGSVTSVERGGKVKERARLGVRFHTLVLGDGSEVRLQTEAVYREGESPAGDSAKKIGGAAVGGAILGAILGGKKGAAIGGATGAAGGTAAVMASERSAATLSRGEIVTAKLSSPATITVERRE